MVSAGRARDKLIFQANYDGSWESYLEDFIMKAHPGQTAAWCNGVGFPRTKFLIQEGAQDGDRFKRWVRRQQVLSQFWYSRFPYLTTDQIRNNALIHDGLARATTDTAARAWLDCFGSTPRPDYAIETDEVQSLVFRGMNTLLLRCVRPDKTAAPVGTTVSNWLRSLVRYPQRRKSQRRLFEGFERTLWNNLWRSPVYNQSRSCRTRRPSLPLPPPVLKNLACQVRKSLTVSWLHFPTRSISEWQIAAVFWVISEIGAQGMALEGCGFRREAKIRPSGPRSMRLF